MTKDGARQRRHLRIIRLLRLIVKTSRKKSRGEHLPTEPKLDQLQTSSAAPFAEAQPTETKPTETKLAEAQPTKRGLSPASWRTAAGVVLCGGGLLATSFLVGAQWSVKTDRADALDLTWAPDISAPADTSDATTSGATGGTTGEAATNAAAGTDSHPASWRANSLIDAAPTAPCVAELRGKALVVTTDQMTPGGRIAIRVNGDGAVAERFNSLPGGGPGRWVLSDTQTGREGGASDDLWTERWVLAKPNGVADKLIDIVASAPWPIGGLARATDATGCRIAVLDTDIHLVDPPLLPDPDFPD